MKSIVIALAFLCSACAVAPSAVFDTSSAAFATKADVPVARAALKRSLKDPESARFSGEAFRPGAICGLVNSKNSYGGYVGDFAYLYVLATGEVYVLQSTGDHTEDGTVLAKFERYCQT